MRALILIGLTFLLSGYSYNQTGLTSVYFDVASYQGKQYDLQLQYSGVDIDSSEILQHRTSVGHSYTFYRTGKFSMYWDNEIVGVSTNRQYRYVAWDFELGMKISSFHFYYHHISEHLLDSATNSHFPLENRVGVRWYMKGGR